MKTLKLHFSLHDVCPTHLNRLIVAEELFEKWGVQKVTYLLVPFFHQKAKASESAEFLEFVKRKRPFEVEWCLHGFFHQEILPDGYVAQSAQEKFKRKHMTGGEGEFLSLVGEDLTQRLSQGIEIYQKVLDQKPLGFVPPAWLYHPALDSALAALGIEWTEDHSGIRSTQNPLIKKEAPVITWATRTPLRLYGSLVVCPSLALLWKHKQLLRIAVHPHDFDFKSTRKSIQRVLTAEIKRREQVLVREDIF